MHETRLKWPRPVNFAFTVLDAGLFEGAIDSPLPAGYRGENIIEINVLPCIHYTTLPPRASLP